ncbi:MAG: hypothetical protein GYA14_09795 [Ignavibacteria bacterium]|nr:hypothetical protein [Ignavibacteria bacterium]
MKEIYLNTDQTRCGKPLEDFVRDKSSNYDIFCFQEVPRTKVGLLKECLPGFEAVVAHKKYYGNCEYGQATFFKKSLFLNESGKILKNGLVGFAIWTRFNINGSDLTIVNLHGVPQPGDKKDNNVRMKQSEMLLRFLENVKGRVIIGGDFNLDVDTKSVKMIEDAGYRNLIKDFGIKTTRNSLAWRKFQDVSGFVKQYFADYCFVSPDVKVDNFEVPYVEVSDHLPLILDFDI